MAIANMTVKVDVDTAAVDAAVERLRAARGDVTGLERRAFAVDRMAIERAETREGETRLIVGHAAVFDREVDIGGWFTESVAPGAFKRAIAEDDVRSLFNHDPNFILGRNRAGTLKLSEDGEGLLTTTIPPDTSYARDLLVSIERGDVSQMSFGFRVLKQEWDESGEMLKRRILEVELFDVSPVTFPAYPQTDVGLRTLAEEARASIRAGRHGLITFNAAPIVRRRLAQRMREQGF